ncbi:MAG: M20 family metallopeptidase [Vicingaceae bacterium]
MTISQQQISESVKKYGQELLSIRRHLHQHPELSFVEYKTSAYIASQLKEWGIAYKQVADTGLIAEIRGRNPQKRLIVLRGDIDALPIQEQTGLPFASINEGVMHACGHDVHTSCVLGSGRILNELKDQFEGTVKLLFQPGEEVLPGGATKIIASGVLNDPKPDAIIGQHVYAELEAGKLGFRPGMYMASGDEIHVKLRGPGGHAAMPDRTVDILNVASRFILGMQEEVYQNVPEKIPTVLTFGKIEGKGATNVIPKEVTIAGTFRTMNEDWRDEAHGRMKSFSEKLALESKAVIELDIRKGYPCLVNDENLTAMLKSLAQKNLTTENVVDLDIRMTAEDFSYYSQHFKACFYRLGIRTPGKEVTNLHSPDFVVDESALETGVNFMVCAALHYLEI